MAIRWKVVLPFFGLIVFAGISWHSYANPLEGNAAVGRYFYVWSTIRLDSHPRPERLRNRATQQKILACHGGSRILASGIPPQGLSEHSRFALCPHSSSVFLLLPFLVNTA